MHLGAHFKFKSVEELQHGACSDCNIPETKTNVWDWYRSRDMRIESYAQQAGGQLDTYRLEADYVALHAGLDQAKRSHTHETWHSNIWYSTYKAYLQPIVWAVFSGSRTRSVLREEFEKCLSVRPFLIVYLKQSIFYSKMVLSSREDISARKSRLMVK